jgi:polysaccharide export outer membrane protein
MRLLHHNPHRKRLRHHSSAVNLGATCSQQFVCLCVLLLSALSVTGCRNAMFQAHNLPLDLRARPSVGDVSFNMARMTGNGYDNSLIGPDDLLDVTVVTGRDNEEARPVAVRVGKEGAVEVSPIGPVQVGGLDPVDAGQLIASTAIERGIYVQPNVTVEFKKKAVNHITVLGAVEKPGLIEVPRNSCDVVSAIAMAGGVSKEAGSEVEIIRQHMATGGDYTRFAQESSPDTKEGEIELAAYSTLNNAASAPVAVADGQAVTQRINLADVAARNVYQDYRLQDRDVVMVQSKPKRTIHVGGLVKNPGQFELSHTEDVRLLDAIALAGGSSSIIADKVYIIRPTSTRPQPIVIQASMQRAKHDGQENLILAEGDMISIEQTPATAVFETLSKLFHLTVGVSGNNFF